jgi:bacterioferritin-associated ferredoxin
MDDIEICHCNGIMKSEIVKAITTKGLKTVEEVQDETTAGTVCGGCIPDIEEILSQMEHGSDAREII